MSENKELTEKKLAFEICDTNKAGSLDKEQIYHYLCALGLTPSQAVREGLPASADEAAAIGLYDKYKADPTCGPFELEAVQQWFETWDPDCTGILDTANLKGEMEDGVSPLTADEMKQLEEMANISGGEWHYKDLMGQMVADQKMKTGTA